MSLCLEKSMLWRLNFPPTEFLGEKVKGKGSLTLTGPVSCRFLRYDSSQNGIIACFLFLKILKSCLLFLALFLTIYLKAA